MFCANKHPPPKIKVQSKNTTKHFAPPQPNAPSITTSLLLVKAISSILVNHLSLMMTQNKTNLNLFSPYSLNLSITISIKFSKYLGISNFTMREIAI